MTNLSSEQYRDVLKNVENCTEKIPTVQQLLRKAVETFYSRFGAYPEIAGVAPGKIGIFGDQTQFNGGLALPTATPMATIVVGRRAAGSRYTVVTSADVGKPHKINFSFSDKRPLAPGCPNWLNYVKGVIENYEYEVPPFEAAIESSVPMGVGFGSSSAIEIATYSFLEVLVGKKADPIRKALACQKAEREFASKDVGLVDRVTAVLAKDRHTMLLDCKTNEVRWIPFKNRDLVFVAVDSHEKDTLFGDEYPERSRYIAMACKMLQVESLRECTEDHVIDLENKVNEILENNKENDEEEEENDENTRHSTSEAEKEEKDNEVWSKEEYDIMIKRVRFFVSEVKRITEAVEAWNEGDVETFGNKMKESHQSLKEDFDFNNPLLEFLVETSLEVEGVLGSRMTGMGLGFGGGIISLIKKENIASYCNYVTEKYMAHEGEISEALKEQRMEDKQNRYEIRKRIHSEHYNPAIASSEKIGKIQDMLDNGEGTLKKVLSPRRLSLQEQKQGRLEKNKVPCIVKVEKAPGGCGTWAHYEKNKQKEKFFRKISQEAEEKRKSAEEEKANSEKEEIEGSKSPSQVSEISKVELKAPTFYVISPFEGARMILVNKTDILRSIYACPLPHPKALLQSARDEFKKEFNNRVEATAVAPGTLTLFGEFMEFHLGYIICMALPMVIVTVGGRNDSVYFSIKTTSKEVEEPRLMKNPLPCVRPLEMESRSWVNYAAGTVNEFKGHVPGFNAVVSSSVPTRVGVNSCAAFQASLYTFLEHLTRNCTTDPFEKADRCGKSEYEFLPTPSELVTRCSTIKFFPTFLCEDGHLMFINCKRYKISQYFFDHPSYVFLVGFCKKNTTKVTIENLDERLKMCIHALETLSRNSLLTADLKHLRCLKKRDASDETIKRVKYVITEHQRTMDAVRAIKEEDYERVGILMNQSHASLRDDYEVSSPEIESLIELALGVDGVLGAKMLGRGLNATVIILVKISQAENCIRYMRKNYKPKNDKPVFYITKPARGSFMMDPE